MNGLNFYGDTIGIDNVYGSDGPPSPLNVPLNDVCHNAHNQMGLKLTEGVANPCG